MSALYILDESGEKPVRCDDWGEWADWFENSKIRQVDAALFGGGKILVSTVFLGVDHGGLGVDHDGLHSNPVVWETMVFRVEDRAISGDSIDYDRCTGNREQAEAMHKLMCAQVEAMLSLEMEIKA